jgi:hypothetical protein
MAVSSLVPKNGAIAYGGYVADFASFDIDGSQAVDNVTPYGTNTCSKNVGSGTPTFTFNVGAFALAHATNTPFNLPGTSTIFSSGGATATFTLDTGVTESGTVITERFRVSHARMRGYVPIAITARNGAEITEVYATT